VIDEEFVRAHGFRTINKKHFVTRQSFIGRGLVRSDEI
jgi:hypothetical protein